MPVRRAATVVLLLAGLVLPASRGLAQTGASDPYLDFLLARRLEQAGDVEGALAALERAAKADPASAEVRAELAAVHMRQNDAEAAEKAARAALDRNPESVEAHRVLGTIYAAYAEGAAENGREASAPKYVEEAIGHLEKVAATPGGATDANVLYGLGRLHLRAGRTEDAIERLSRVVEQNPYSVQARLSLAQALAAAERYGDAAPVSKRARAWSRVNRRSAGCWRCPAAAAAAASSYRFARR